MVPVGEATGRPVAAGRIPEEVGSAPAEAATSLGLAVAGMVLEEEES